MSASNSIVLTADGRLKISGVGEPAWLSGGTDPGVWIKLKRPAESYAAKFAPACSVAALIPAYFAARLDPVKALRYE